MARVVCRMGDEGHLSRGSDDLLAFGACDDLLWYTLLFLVIREYHAIEQIWFLL